MVFVLTEGKNGARGSLRLQEVGDEIGVGQSDETAVLGLDFGIE